eukprot:gene9639-9799_t
MSDKNALAAIFRRGGQKRETVSGAGALADEDELERQLQQLASAWAVPKATCARATLIGAL